jgi:hypothetical protein
MAIFADIWVASATEEEIGGMKTQNFRLPIEIDDSVSDWSMTQWSEAIETARKKLGLKCATYRLEVSFEHSGTPLVVYQVENGEVQEAETPLTALRMRQRFHSEIQRRRAKPLAADGVGPYIYSSGADVIRIVE